MTIRKLQQKAIGRPPACPFAFFRATEEFLEWLSRRVGARIVVDAGCGNMDLVDRMGQKCIRACGIDLRTVEYTNPLRPFVPCDAREFTYPKDGHVIIARPDAYGWVYEAIQHALSCGVREVLYIGGHYTRDLQWAEEDLSVVLEEVYQNAGEDGETAWSLSLYPTQENT